MVLCDSLGWKTCTEQHLELRAAGFVTSIVDNFALFYINPLKSWFTTTNAHACGKGKYNYTCSKGCVIIVVPDVQSGVKGQSHTVSLTVYFSIVTMMGMFQHSIDLTYNYILYKYSGLSHNGTCICQLLIISSKIMCWNRGCQVIHCKVSYMFRFFFHSSAQF